MAEVAGSETAGLYQALRRQFYDAFVEEMMPGVIHNFANPLNGIMGRLRILERRIEEQAKGVREGIDPGAQSLRPRGTVASDVGLLNRESEKMSALLQRVAEKIIALNNTAVQQVSLADLLDLEMRFYEFHLDFKHEVKKSLNLDREIPQVTGSPADFTLVFSSLIRYAILAMSDSPDEEMAVSTGAREGFARVEIAYTGFGAPPGRDPGSDPAPAEGCPAGTGDILGALYLEKKYKARCQIERNDRWHRLLIDIPFGEPQ
jgi:signal transduction histidine kinase